MKKLLLLFSAMLCASLVNSQTDASVMLELNGGTLPVPSTSSYDQSYIATLPTGENLVATSLSDGAAYFINIKKIHLDGSVTTIKNILTSEPLLGITCSSTGNFSCFFGQGMAFNLMKFSSSGSVLWQKSISISETISTYYKHSMNETPAGDYYLTISNSGFTGLVKIDVNGNYLWSKKITGPRDTGKCPGFSTAVTLSGGTVTTMKDDSYETIVNLDPNGDLVWSRSFGDASYRWTKTIRADNLGNFYIMGTYGNVGSTFIQKMDANGNLVYGKNISGSISYEDAFVTAANDFFILSQHPSMQLSKVGAAGNILWSRGIGGISAGPVYMYPTYFTSTGCAPEISFLSSVNDSTGLVFKFSGNPAELCNSYNYAMQNTADDAQIFDAVIDTTATINPMIVTIANTGFGTSAAEYYTSDNFCAFIASISETETSPDLYVYPNPSSSYINIELTAFKNIQNAVIILYDITGKKVIERPVMSSTIEKISTAEFAPGLYTIVISDLNSILGKQRIVIQK